MSSSLTVAPMSGSGVPLCSVRFQDTCILIPPAVPSKNRPRLVRKSYSLPLWRSPSSSRKSESQPSISDSDSPSSTDEKSNNERKPFILTLSIPSLIIKPRSPRPSLHPASPCLSKRNPNDSLAENTTSLTNPSTPPTPTSPPFRSPPSFPTVEQSSPSPSTATVPLRPCCEACLIHVDHALAQGESWSPRWSRGAARRYSVNESRSCPVDFPCSPVNDPRARHISLADALNVDEVDAHRRRSTTFNNHPLPPVESDEEDLPVQFSCDDSAVPVICEEDESMLFPLPPPRRSLNLPRENFRPINLSSDLPHPDALPVDFQRPPSRSSPLSPPPRARSTSPGNGSKARRPSFTTIIKGSVSVLRGVAAGMSDAGISIAR